MKKLSLLGSTGSIGTQTLEVVRQQPGSFIVEALAAHSNIVSLKKQIEEFSPTIVAVYDKMKADELKAQSDIEVVSGMEGLKKVAKTGDLIVNALVGSVGIEPTFSALKAKKDIALANKETLVAAGDIVNKMKESEIIPIDSEHSAIFQCLHGWTKSDIKSLTLTCSGGPFRNVSDVSKVSVKDALDHPNWAMGKKITIDSATLMNKGLEVIEAHMLFHVPYEHISVVIHPQSIVHSLVEFKDTSMIAQLGWPDMKVPIQYALSYPRRLPSSLKSLDLTEVKSLEFDIPDTHRFPCLHYAYEAGKIGGSMPCAMNAANEKAVKMFLDGKLPFLGIPEMIKEEMQKHKVINNPELDDILDIDRKIKGI